jgi:vacuolar-type H+-ATPase subunit I/STV1
MTQSGTERSRICRDRTARGLVKLEAWVPADKLEACKDAIDKIVKGDTND